MTHYYAIDPFHEGGNMGDMNPSAVYRRVQEKMLEHDPQAIWLMQQWQGQITDEKISSLCKPEQALILDLQADKRCFHEIMERHQVPWVWCMVHNFGGRMGVDGDLATLMEIPEKFKNSKYMVGIGAAPEAYNSGPIVYDLLCDMTWKTEATDCGEYVQTYVRSRYGKDNANLQRAWEILLRTAYRKKEKYTQGAAECVINARPSEQFTAASTWGHRFLEYNPKELEEALPCFLAAYEEFSDRETYRYDLVDLTKQIMSNTANDWYDQMMEAYRNKDGKAFREISSRFLEWILLEDRVLGCCAEFTVGKWIAAARNVLPDAEERVKDLMEFNARALLTTWGDRKNSENCLLDYSNRQWAGLTRDYYYRRWENFVTMYQKSLDTGTAPEPMEYFPMEWAWVNQKDGYGYAKTASNEDLKALAQKVYQMAHTSIKSC